MPPRRLHLQAGASAPPLLQHPVRAALASLALVLSLALPARAGSLVGQVLLDPPYPLPPDAVLDVQLLDVSRADAPAVLQGRSRQELAGMRSPFPFVVRYLDGAIRPDRRYQLRATIRQGDRLLFTTDTAHPVLDGRRGPLQLPLVPVGDAPLRGLQWLRAPAAGVPAPPGAPRQEQQLRLDPLSRELSGSADCNRFIGTFRLEGEQLRLIPITGTTLLCEPEVMADEQRFLADLRQVRRWRLDQRGRLELRDANNVLLLLLETRPSS